MVYQTGFHFDLSVAFVVMEQMDWLTFGMCLAFGKTFDSHQPLPALRPQQFYLGQMHPVFVKFLIVLNAHGQLCGDG